MKILNKLKNKLREKEEQEKKEYQRELEEERKDKLLQKKYNACEKKLYPKKLELAKRIFVWKNDFLETAEGKKVLNSFSGEIEVYSDKWGHTLIIGGDYGCWARINFTKSKIEYKSGYKWLGFRGCFDFKKPDEMAKRINHNFLSGLWKHLESGNVFDYIARELKEN